MEGGKISDFRCGDWLIRQISKKNESLSNYFLQLASTRNYLFQLEEIKFAAARFLLYNRTQELSDSWWLVWGCILSQRMHPGQAASAGYYWMYATPLAV